MNMNMVSMAMGREVRGGEVKGRELYYVLCHLLRLLLTGQGVQCVQRILCQASPRSGSHLNTFLARSTR